eukprot:1136364-Amphidinium_carterae.1
MAARGAEEERWQVLRKVVLGTICCTSQQLQRAHYKAVLCICCSEGVGLVSYAHVGSRFLTLCRLAETFCCMALAAAQTSRDALFPAASPVQRSQWP